MDAQALRDLMIGHTKVGDGEWHRFDYDAAIELYEQAMEVTDRMIEANLLKAQSIPNLVVIRQKIAEYSAQKIAVGNLDDILNSPQDTIPLLLALRLQELSRKGQLAEVAVAASKLQEIRPLAADNLYMAAYGYCRCVMILDAPPVGGVLDRLPLRRAKLSEEQQTERNKYLRHAIDAFQSAVATGWNDFDEIESNDDLAPLRDLPEFQKLLKEKKPKRKSSHGSEHWDQS